MVEATEVVDVDKSTVTVAEGESVVVVATVDGKNITQGARWRSDDPEVATVSPNGVITGVSAGNAEVTVSWPAADGDATVDVTVGNYSGLFRDRKRPLVQPFSRKEIN